MDTRKLRYFITVAREGSFSRAADVLHMTQPPLSMAIAGLEKEVGVSLLVRTPRGVTPTQAGQYLFENGDVVLAQLEGLAGDLRKIGAGVKGRITIASVPVVTWLLLPSVLRRFLATSPEVDVSVADLPPAQVIDRVVHGQVDLGVIATVDLVQLYQAYSEDLYVRHCGDLLMAAGLPPRMGDAPERVSLRDLHSETWLIPARTMRIRSIEDSFNGLWTRLRLARPRVRPVTTLQTAIPLVVAGLGVTLFPSALRPMSHPDLVVREFAESVPPLQIALLWPKRGHQPKATEKLLSEFTEM